MNYYRKTIVDIMVSWLGKNEADGSFKSIVDLYNTIRPLPRGYKAPYSTPWCAITVSAAFHKAGYGDIFPFECSCGKIIEHSIPKGIWVENDAFVPQPGDCILYDWDDNGKGDNKGWPDHIGVVEKVEGQTLTIIEGNCSNKVMRRKIAVNAKNIRGYVVPKFTAYSQPTTPAPSIPATPVKLKFNKGDIVEFTGTVHYASASATKGVACKPGKAKITNTYNGTHPYHCIATDDSKGNVYGWVDEKYIKAITQTPAKPKEVKASAYAQKGPDNSISCNYKVTTATDIRDNAGTKYKSLAKLPKGTVVRCYGYYTPTKSSKWLYVQATISGVKYTGFVNASHLKKS